MDLERLAQMVAKAQDDKGISDYALEHEIGRPGGKAFNAKQLKRWKDGERIQAIPRPVVLRIIEILDLPADETAELAGVWPPRRTAAMLRELDRSTSELTARYVGQTALPVPAELQDAALLRRLGVPNLERRRAERRRRPRLVPQMEQVAA
jgi:hypothetical protein